MFGQILSAVAGPLISGLFGQKKAPQTTTTVNYRKLRDAAIKGGFNPLTAIRNGGAAGFTTTTHPALSRAPAVGQAISNLGTVLANQPSQADIRRDKLEYQILEKQLENLRTRSPISKARFGDVPVIQTTGGSEVKGPALTRMVTGRDGEQISIPNMDVAADPETTLMVEAEQGKLLDKLGELGEKNKPDWWKTADEWERKLNQGLMAPWRKIPQAPRSTSLRW